MRILTFTVWLFINILFFGMGGYMYITWSKYWASITRDEVFKDAMEPKYKLIGSVGEKAGQNLRESLMLVKVRRSAIGLYWKHKDGKKTNVSVTSESQVTRKSQGSPRFPNTHTPVLDFDSLRYSCTDSASAECLALTSTFGELIRKEIHRILMSESNVFKSGLASQNVYNVQYNGAYGTRRTREQILCELHAVRVQTVTRTDEPFASFGFKIPEAPLQQHRVFNTCAVVTSSGALLGSRLGPFIDSHDMVLRFNNAPTANYTDDVGSKTTFRVLNSQVVTKPEYNFLGDPLYENVSIIIWDPSNYTSTLEEWYRHPDFAVFDVYKRFLALKPNADVHLLMPQKLWEIWTVLQRSSPYRLRKNPPSSGFIGIWFAVQRCSHVRVFEFVPSARATARCHYYAPRRDRACTLGSWHPLAQEKAVADLMRHNTDFEVFQRGFIDVSKNFTCPE